MTNYTDKYRDHFRPDGSCDCPMDGKCIECGRACNDHDMVADWWWCGDCVNRSFVQLENNETSTDNSSTL